MIKSEDAVHMAVKVLRRYGMCSPDRLVYEMGITVLSRPFAKQKGTYKVIERNRFIFIEEQFKTFLEKTVLTEHGRRILDGLTAQNAVTAPAQGAGTAAHG